MERRPIIIVNTDNYPTFCDNRCNNTDCSRHISKMRFQNQQTKGYRGLRGVHIKTAADITEMRVMR